MNWREFMMRSPDHKIPPSSITTDDKLRLNPNGTQIRLTSKTIKDLAGRYNIRSATQEISCDDSCVTFESVPKPKDNEVLVMRVDLGVLEIDFVEEAYNGIRERMPGTDILLLPLDADLQTIDTKVLARLKDRITELLDARDYDKLMSG